MKEEDFIRKKCSSNDPFRVPDGYFENFASELMGRLPERPVTQVVSPARHVFRLSKYAAAAVFCGLAVWGAMRITHKTASGSAPVCSVEKSLNESVNCDMDDYLDYAMISNQEIAQYLTEVN